MIRIDLSKYEGITPGEWEVKGNCGYGDGLGIFTPDRQPPNYALAVIHTPKEHYTEFPKYVDGDGDTRMICSTEAARKAGNYIATPEIKAAILAQMGVDAKAIANLPKILTALADAYAEIDALKGALDRQCTFAENAMPHIAFWDTAERAEALSILKKDKALLNKEADDATETS